LTVCLNNAFSWLLDNFSEEAMRFYNSAQINSRSLFHRAVAIMHLEPGARRVITVQ
jgi:hypothetical protein